MIDMVSVQNLLAPYCCVSGKDTLRHFPPFGGLSKQILNFSHISVKQKKQIKKISTGQQYLGISEVGLGNCLPYGIAAPPLSCESGGQT